MEESSVSKVWHQADLREKNMIKAGFSDELRRVAELEQRNPYASLMVVNEYRPHLFLDAERS